MPTTERSVTHASDEANEALKSEPELDSHARLKKRTSAHRNFKRKGGLFGTSI
jgi:hypothetical protein